ncbi:helix-turn-helix domain-containing protein [Acidipropionibacterium acidipropionici]|uniref:helix-turn-helix domain-containing protein n=1 Tax=Acidipropionibacterium acidipropionici TaxID=1748 RepID=UPI0003FFD0DD|nr:helix-turn-helix transcriptional regulator [Acidipropionibacterium acidipropionici]ALN14337.1 hypothetical protein ASQ49_02600 [Acidipropionibacterium acidipropionici]APZ09900.1 transcriptional regulator [Acidipropionibacterium acidipropionici]
MCENSQKIFVRRLRQERRAARMTQAVLASRMTERLDGVAIDASIVTRIERGQRGVSLDEAVAAAESVGVPLTRLLDPEGRPEHAEVAALRLAVETAVQTLEAIRNQERRQQEEVERLQARLADVDRDPRTAREEPDHESVPQGPGPDILAWDRRQAPSKRAAKDALREEVADLISRGSQDGFDEATARIREFSRQWGGSTPDQPTDDRPE